MSVSPNNTTSQTKHNYLFSVEIHHSSKFDVDFYRVPGRPRFSEYRPTYSSLRRLKAVLDHLEIEPQVHISTLGISLDYTV